MSSPESTNAVNAALGAAFRRSLQACQEQVNARLAALVPAQRTTVERTSRAHAAPRRVYAAMHYALTSPGKRLRPFLTLSVAELFGGSRLDRAAVLDLACAIEMVHACSLILDDMPMMDDASLRRGRETVHRVYGDDVAALASFALLNRAFGLVAERAARLRLGRYTSEDLIHHLTSAVGTDGLIGGQALDLEGRSEALELDRLEYIHSHKTGALFLCAAELGAMAADARRRDLQAITGYAKNVGLAFQITDDLLDVEETSETTGKDRGQDADRQTFVTLLGVDGARDLAAELLDFAVASLGHLGPKADDLRGLARLVLTRRQ